MSRAGRQKARSRTRIVATMAYISVRDFREGHTGSMFAHEGAFIAALRSSFCMAGWPWPVADAVARELVGEALDKARAVRPTWAEGQRAYTQTDVTRDAVCRNCGIGLKGRQVNFCSGPCRSRWWELFNREEAA